MKRVYNFSAGPAVLPEEVLNEAAKEMLDYRGTGMSVMEMSHRSKVFEDILNEAEQDIRDLLHIPAHYKVLFLQGGAHLQFAMIPMNSPRDSGRKKPGKRRRFTGRPIKLLPLRTKPFPISRTVRIWISAPMQTMYTSARTIPSTGPSSTPFPIPKESFLCPMYLPAFSQNPWMWRNTALFMEACRRISARPAW